jgi:hypothetical protein
MTEAFFGLKPGTLSSKPSKHICECGNEHEVDDEDEGDRTAADYADDEPIETE